MLPPIFKAEISAESLIKVNDESEIFESTDENTENTSQQTRGDISTFKKNVVSSYMNTIGEEITEDEMFPFDFSEE